MCKGGNGAAGFILASSFLELRTKRPLRCANNAIGVLRGFHGTFKFTYKGKDSHRRDAVMAGMAVRASVRCRSLTGNKWLRFESDLRGMVPPVHARVPPINLRHFDKNEIVGVLNYKCNVLTCDVAVDADDGDARGIAALTDVPSEQITEKCTGMPARQRITPTNIRRMQCRRRISQTSCRLEPAEHMRTGQSNDPGRRCEEKWFVHCR